MSQGILSFAALLALSGLPSLAVAGAYPPVDVPMRLEQVSAHVYFVRGEPGAATDNAGFISNAGVVVTPEGLVFIDALGSPSLAAKFLALVRQVSDLPVRRVILTHYHADHVYGLQVFKDLGAEVWAPEGARDYLSADTAENLLATRRVELAPWINAETHLVPPDRYLTADADFTLGGVRFRVTPLGVAHSEGDLAVFVEPDGVMFSGDIIFEGRIPWLGSSNTRNWLATLERMERITVRALIPGHGKAAAKPREALTLTRRYLAFVREKMGAAVRNWEAFDDAYDGIDWGEWEFLPAFAEANRRNAYQVFLSLERESLEKP